jgi:hypothetical protein
MPSFSFETCVLIAQPSNGPARTQPEPTHFGGAKRAAQQQAHNPPNIYTNGLFVLDYRLYDLDYIMMFDNLDY